MATINSAIGFQKIFQLYDQIQTGRSQLPPTFDMSGPYKTPLPYSSSLSSSFLPPELREQLSPLLVKVISAEALSSEEPLSQEEAMATSGLILNGIKLFLPASITYTSRRIERAWNNTEGFDA